MSWSLGIPSSGNFPFQARPGRCRLFIAAEGVTSSEIDTQYRERSPVARVTLQLVPDVTGVPST